MTWIISTLAYLLGHFLVYALMLRHLPRFTRERVIFAYHALSELGWAVVLVVGTLAGLWSSDGLAGWVGAVALHGIYSLTFLSLWSLASGGYSIGILAQVARVGDGARVERVDLESIGVGKQEARMQGLAGLGLVRSRAQCVETTPRGALVAAALATIATMFGVRESG
jgi:hypothetical protein